MSPPEECSIEQRQARARGLDALDRQLVEVITHAQNAGIFEGELSASLGLALQAIRAHTVQHWPGQSWETTSEGGPPQPGDLDVKVVSVLDDARTGVELRIGISAILDATDPDDHTRTTRGDEAVIFCPLALATHLICALQEQVAYWHDNPPDGGVQ